LQETLAAAYRGGALSVRATEAVAVDTTVQEKAIALRPNTGYCGRPSSSWAGKRKRRGCACDNRMCAWRGERR
jgi:hypothetical protein